MGSLKKYNTGTSQWEPVAVGPAGPAGPSGPIGYTGSSAAGGGATFLTIGTRTTAINVGVATSSSLNVVARTGNVAVNFT